MKSATFHPLSVAPCGGRLTSFIILAKVARVLLADGWHPVADGSFSVGTNQFRLGSGNVVSGLVEPVATWTEKQPVQNSNQLRLVKLAAPIMQILALEYEEEDGNA